MWSESFTGELPQEKHDLVELVKQIRNRCEIYLYLAGEVDTEMYLWTLLEDIYEDAQKVALEHCALDDGST